MSFFIDKHNRRKSPIALAAFGAALLDLCVFGLLYAVLAEPLYRAVALGGAAATTALHSVIIAAVGTAVCCLLFLLRDKRVAPYGFAGLAVILCMFYAAAALLESAARSNILALISWYGLAPVLLGNAVTWPIYLKIKRGNPALNHRKTIQEELRAAAAKEAAKQAEKRPARRPPVKEQAPAPGEEPGPSPEEALFGPEAGGSPAAFRTAQEEAMLLYEDDEEESDD